MSDLAAILSKLEELQSSGLDPDTLKRHGVTATPFMWRVSNEGRGCIGEITRSGRYPDSFTVFCYRWGENISEHDTSSLDDAIIRLRWRDECNCGEFRSHPMYCKCEAREKYYPGRYSW